MGLSCLKSDLDVVRAVILQVLELKVQNLVNSQQAYEGQHKDRVYQQSTSWVSPLGFSSRIDRLKIDDVRMSFTVVEEMKPMNYVTGKGPRAHPILIPGDVLFLCECMIWYIKKEDIPSTS